MIDAARLRAALDDVRHELDEAAVRSGRGAGAVELIVAGKYVPAEETPALIEAGVEIVGENRLQDLRARRALAGGRLRFDFIGHLQRRKVRDVIPAVRLFHALDSERLAAAIAARAAGPVRLLVEVNAADEETKGGVVPSELASFLDRISEHPQIVVGGLMAMPPQATDAEASRPHFAAVRELAEELRPRFAARHDLSDLSMGTSQDYVVAAEEGATMVRVGRGVIARAEVHDGRE